MDLLEWISTEDLQKPPWNFRKSQILELMRAVPAYNEKGDRTFWGSIAMDLSGDHPRIVGGPPEMAKPWPSFTPEQNAIVVDHILADVYFKRPDVERFQQSRPITQAADRKPVAATLKQDSRSAKTIFRAYSKGIIDQAQSEGMPMPTRAGLAERVLAAHPDVKNPKTGQPYDTATVIDWIRDLFPDYKPLKPGAKPKKWKNTGLN